MPVCPKGGLHVLMSQPLRHQEDGDAVVVLPRLRSRAYVRKNLCLGLDIWVPKLVEAENEGILVEVENGT